LRRQVAEQSDEWGRQFTPSGELRFEVREISGRRQRMIPEQIDDLFEGRSLRDVVNVKAAINQLPFFAVDLRETAIGHDCVAKAAWGSVAVVGTRISSSI
jgi:hypothetical protein